jgi:folate-binding protein YgfZ
MSMAESSTRGYDAADRSVALHGRSDRVRIELTGPDRAKVLHNLTTNDIKRLAPGRGCEAFLTSGQGRTLAFLQVHAEEERLLVRSDPDTAGAILDHLAKYAMFEDATVRDVSSETSEWHLFGPAAEETARSVGLPLPDGDLGIARGTIEGAAVRVIREAPTGRPGLTIVREVASGDDGFMLALRKAIDAHGGAGVVHEAFEALRIEAGTPVFGQDVTVANLPQEVGRDARAISFVKGCYLGQETVARLDALGHVNKILVGLVGDTDRVPPPGSTLLAEGKEIGVVTSSAFSPGWGRSVDLGYVKVAHSRPGSALAANVDDGAVALTVHSLPMLPTQRAS